VRFIQMGLIEL